MEMEQSPLKSFQYDIREQEEETTSSEEDFSESEEQLDAVDLESLLDDDADSFPAAYDTTVSLGLYGEGKYTGGIYQDESDPKDSYYTSEIPTLRRVSSSEHTFSTVFSVLMKMKSTSPDLTLSNLINTPTPTYDDRMMKFALMSNVSFQTHPLQLVYILGFAAITGNAANGLFSIYPQLDLLSAEAPSTELLPALGANILLTQELVKHFVGASETLESLLNSLFVSTHGLDHCGVGLTLAGKYSAMNAVLNTQVQSLIDGRTSWNELFQEVLQMPESDLNESQLKHQRISQVANNFVHTARIHATTIISELFLPDAMKSIKAVQIGGMAGGTKFIASGILFKLATDEFGLYDGFEGAMKVAGHDLKGLSSYFGANVPALRTPLACLIDYRGFRVIAMSTLPVGKATLKYGSADYGRTVLNSDQSLAAKMKEAGKALNLKGHIVGESGVKLYAPGDIEGHVGTDGNYYVLDFSRTFPPAPDGVGKQAPTKGSFLFRLIRPECVARNPVPLSPDAFSRFGRADSKVHNLEVRNCWKRLISEQIPSFACSLDESIIPSSDDSKRQFQDSLPSQLHRSGINMRLMGLVRSAAHTEYIRSALLLEMVSRVFKKKVEASLRLRMRELRLPGDEPYLEVVCFHFNLLIGASSYATKSHDYWKEIKIELVKKFTNALNEIELSDSISLKTLIDLRSLVRRCQELLGAPFTTAAGDAFNSSDVEAFEFIESDISELHPVVKELGVSLLSQAIATSVRAQHQKAERLFHASYKKFSTAALITGKPLAYTRWAETYLAHAQLVNEPESISLLTLACKHFHTSLSLRRGDIAIIAAYFSTLLLLFNSTKDIGPIADAFQLFLDNAKAIASSIKVNRHHSTSIMEVMAQLISLLYAHLLKFKRIPSAPTHSSDDVHTFSKQSDVSLSSSTSLSSSSSSLTVTPRRPNQPPPEFYPEMIPSSSLPQLTSLIFSVSRLISSSPSVSPAHLLPELSKLLILMLEITPLPHRVRARLPLFPRGRGGRFRNHFAQVDFASLTRAWMNSTVSIQFIGSARVSKIIAFINQMGLKWSIPLIQCLTDLCWQKNGFETSQYSYPIIPFQTDLIRSLENQDLFSIYIHHDRLLINNRTSDSCQHHIALENSSDNEFAIAHTCFSFLSVLLDGNTTLAPNLLLRTVIPVSVNDILKSDSDSTLNHDRSQSPQLPQADIHSILRALELCIVNNITNTSLCASLLSLYTASSSVLHPHLEKIGLMWRTTHRDALTSTPEFVTLFRKLDPFRPGFFRSKSASPKIPLQSSSNSIQTSKRPITSSADNSETELISESVPVQSDSSLIHLMSRLVANDTSKVSKNIIDQFVLLAIDNSDLQRSPAFMTACFRFLHFKLAYKLLDKYSLTELVFFIFSPSSIAQILPQARSAFLSLLLEFYQLYLVPSAIHDFLQFSEAIWKWGPSLSELTDYDPILNARIESIFQQGESNCLNLSRLSRRVVWSISYLPPSMVLKDIRHNREYVLVRQQAMHGYPPLSHSYIAAFLAQWKIEDKLFEQHDLADILQTWLVDPSSSPELQTLIVETISAYNGGYHLAVLKGLGESEFPLISVELESNLRQIVAELNSIAVVSRRFDNDFMAVDSLVGALKKLIRPVVSDVIHLSKSLGLFHSLVQLLKYLSHVFLSMSRTERSQHRSKLRYLMTQAIRILQKTTSLHFITSDQISMLLMTLPYIRAHQNLTRRLLTKIVLPCLNFNPKLLEELSLECAELFLSCLFELDQRNSPIDQLVSNCTSEDSVLTPHFKGWLSYYIARYDHLARIKSVSESSSFIQSFSVLSPEEPLQNEIVNLKSEITSLNGSRSGPAEDLRPRFYKGRIEVRHLIANQVGISLARITSNLENRAYSDELSALCDRIFARSKLAHSPVEWITTYSPLSRLQYLLLSSFLEFLNKNETLHSELLIRLHIPNYLLPLLGAPTFLATLSSKLLAKLISKRDWLETNSSTLLAIVPTPIIIYPGDKLDQSPNLAVIHEIHRSFLTQKRPVTVTDVGIRFLQLGIYLYQQQVNSLRSSHNISLAFNETMQVIEFLRPAQAKAAEGDCAVTLLNSQLNYFSALAQISGFFASRSSAELGVRTLSYIDNSLYYSDQQDAMKNSVHILTNTIKTDHFEILYTIYLNLHYVGEHILYLRVALLQTLTRNLRYMEVFKILSLRDEFVVTILPMIQRLSESNSPITLKLGLFAYRFLKLSAKLIHKTPALEEVYSQAAKLLLHPTKSFLEVVKDFERITDKEVPVLLSPLGGSMSRSKKDLNRSPSQIKK